MSACLGWLSPSCSPLVGADDKVRQLQAVVLTLDSLVVSSVWDDCSVRDRCMCVSVPSSCEAYRPLHRQFSPSYRHRPSAYECVSVLRRRLRFTRS